MKVMKREIPGLDRASETSRLTITASVRLARKLRQSYDSNQIAYGLVSWAAPEIVPFPSWLERCWRDWLYSGNSAGPIQLLTPSQERVVWERIICESDE